MDAEDAQVGGIRFWCNENGTDEQVFVLPKLKNEFIEFMESEGIQIQDVDKVVVGQSLLILGAPTSSKGMEGKVEAAFEAWRLQHP